MLYCIIKNIKSVKLWINELPKYGKMYFFRNWLDFRSKTIPFYFLPPSGDALGKLIRHHLAAERGLKKPGLNRFTSPERKKPDWLPWSRSGCRTGPPERERFLSWCPYERSLQDDFNYFKKRNFLFFLSRSLFRQSDDPQNVPKLEAAAATSATAADSPPPPPSLSLSLKPRPPPTPRFCFGECSSRRRRRRKSLLRKLFGQQH